ncbi:MAG: acyltransferase family protein, partial [Micromonosporaceae bacterium]
MTTWPGSAVGSGGRSQADPASGGRDPVVDLLRVAAVGVVVLWHWVFSLTYRQGGVLVNPNPIDQLPGSWLLTWVLQVMPLFFVIGGYANLAVWDAMRQRAGRFYVRRFKRLLGPALVFCGVWVAADLVIRLAGYPSTVWTTPILYAPLWFLAVYLGVVLLVPLTARAHRRHRLGTVAGLGALVVAADAARFGYGMAWGGMAWGGIVNTGLVWIFAHQLGYLWRDGVLRPVWRRCAVAAGGLAAIALAVSLGPYPRSLVAVASEELSPMLPTTAVIGALAIW